MKIGKTKNVKGLISDRAVVKVTDAGCQREVRYVKFTRKEGLGVRKVSIYLRGQVTAISALRRIYTVILILQAKSKWDTRLTNYLADVRSNRRKK